jgi:hypothetical protein
MRAPATATLTAFTSGVRRFERSIGAERPGRSPWVWLGPALNVVAPYALFLTHFGELDLFTRLLIATVASVFMGGLSVAYLAAFAGDARDTAADGAGVAWPERSDTEEGADDGGRGRDAWPRRTGAPGARPLQVARVAVGPTPAVDHRAGGADRR